MSDLTLYGHPGSTYVRTARMACEEKGVPYRLEPVGHDEIVARRLHPFGKMPVMRHGERTLWESLAIAMYVDAAFQGPPLLPAEPAERGQAFQWISAIGDYFYRDVIRRYVLASKRGGPADDIDAARRDVRHHFSVVNEALEGRSFLVGERLSLADLYLAPIHAYVTMMPDGPELLSGFKHLARAAETIAARPSFANTDPRRG